MKQVDIKEQTMNYRSWRIIDGKLRWITMDENGNIINKDSVIRRGD